MNVPTLFLTHLLFLLIQLVYSWNSNWGLTECALKFVNEMGKHANEEPPDVIHMLPEYDFIVVGAGSAGCVVANRLTEIPEWNVLLLEAGGQENFLMDVPFNVHYLQVTGANWDYKGVPSNNACLSVTNRQCLFPRGKVLGGSSVLNYMVHTRGNRRDYDNWEKMGNTGWSYNDILPYFLKSEDIAIPELAYDTTYHSTKGYLTTSYVPFHTPLAEAFIQAGKETGQREVDYNGETQIGFSYVQTTTKNGTRWSTSRAFLHPIRDRKNLHIKKRSQVTKILIDPLTRIAYGVEFVHQNRKYRVLARKEVILSAGAINSPQLLMLSGVGPKEHLSDMNISTIQDLKVGYNLMDHATVFGVTFTVNESVSLQSDFVSKDGKNLVDYFCYHQGPLSSTGAVEAIAFYDFKDPTNPYGYPDAELLFVGASIVSDPIVRRTFGLNADVYNYVYKPIENFHTWMVIPLLLKPESRGRIKLNDNNPFSKPLIYHNYFAHPNDVETLVKAIKKIIELGNTESFRKFDAKLNDIPIPGCAKFSFGSDDYWRCFVRHFTFSIFHVSGTCKMGPYTDQDAVVDPRLRVYGINRLRVIDASVMPDIPAGHTNVPAIMIGEKGSDLIKEDWGRI